MGRLLLAMLAFSCMWVGATSAWALTFDYYHASETTSDYWPYCSTSGGCPVAYQASQHSIQEASARTSGNTVCTATWAGNTTNQDTALVCSGDLAYKSLCGCTYRRAYSRGTYDGPRPFGRARDVW